MARVYAREELLERDDRKLGIPAGSLKIVYRDTFNLKYLYYLLHEWFIDNGFLLDKKGNPIREDADFPETMFVHRDFGNNQQIWWRWRFERISPTSPLFRWNIDLDMHILGLKQVESVINGQKVKADSAEIEVVVTSNLFLRISEWKKNPITEYLAPVLEKFVYRKLISTEKRLFETKVWELQESIKTYFKMPTYLPERQLHEFHQKTDFTT